jgi:hypothetical protein
VITYCCHFLKSLESLFLFVANTGRDDDTLLAATADSDAEIVKLKVDDGKMTNDLNCLGIVID